MESKLLLKNYLPFRKLKLLMLIMLMVTGLNRVVSQNINHVEYYFDTDPGFGMATQVNVADPSPDLNNFNFSIGIGSVSSGFHKMFVRVRDENGNWSQPQVRSFYKDLYVPGTSVVSRLEYFIDTDPGLGAATAIPISPDSNLTNLSFAIDISGLEDGFHRIFVRSMDNQHRWSMTTFRAFLRETVTTNSSNITDAEYFMDTDPGLGNGTSLVSQPAGPDVTMDAVIDITGISDGFHHLFVRAKDDHGRWSLTNKRSFLKETVTSSLMNIVKMEYFIDSDPGFGYGNNIPVSASVNLPSVNYFININSLANGFHKIFVRVKTEDGRWSMTSIRSFLKETVLVGDFNIHKAEYFIDTDPGFGNAIDIPVVTDTNDAELNFAIDVTSLPEGFHKLFVRSKDDGKKWSMTNFRAFYKQVFPSDTLPNIVKVEYFIDTDPGVGNGHDVAVTPNQNVPFLAFQLDLTGVEFGQHQLFVRTKDAFGKWSLTTHDTIFYYLDSLPTAVLYGPQGICINSSGAFEVSLTGTPPWRLIIDNGFETDTISNIMSTPYSFTVNPGSAGIKTAKVLKVQDVYYTGLYTGIPIEYEVFPLPGTASAINGPTDICAGSTSAYFWINGIPNATIYEWTLPAGMTVTYGGYSNFIYVNITENATSGIISVIGKNDCGYGLSSSIQVNIHQLPVVNAGPDQTIAYGDSVVLNAIVTGGSEPYSFSWWPYSYLSNSGIADPVAKPLSTMTYSVYVTDVMGCSGSDAILITVGPQPGSTISGQISYANVTNSVMRNTPVFLKQGGSIIQQTLSNYYGDYVFYNVPQGSYTIESVLDKPWGGVNATDALLILKHFAQISLLTGIHLAAADVNADGVINSIDGLQCASRFTFIIDTFNSGDWLVPPQAFIAEVIGSQVINLKAICFGDVNGSNTPEARLEPNLLLSESGKLEATSRELQIPFTLKDNVNAAALSLVLELPEQLIVKGFKMNNDMGTSIFNIEKHTLRAAWYSLTPIHYNSGDILFWLKADADENVNGNYCLGVESNIADFAGESIRPIRIMVPTIIMNHESDIQLTNYPNPFKDNSLITYSTPTDGKVKLELIDMDGRSAGLLVDEFKKAGSYQYQLNANTLKQGIYQCRLLLVNGERIVAKTHKISVQK